MAEKSGKKGGFLLIGVTGGIATGKSAVSKILESLGCRLIDLDHLARQVVEPGEPAWEAIVAHFGKEVVRADGRIDRKRLSEIVFADVEKRKKLEGITHPLILQEFHRQVNEMASRDPDAILLAAVPLLMELNLQHGFDKVLVVYAPQETQIHRLMARDGISKERAMDILKAQMPIEEKLSHADFVIRNQGSLEETRRQVEAVWEELKKMQEEKVQGKRSKGIEETGVKRRTND